MCQPFYHTVAVHGAEGNFCSNTETMVESRGVPLCVYMCLYLLHRKMIWIEPDVDWSKREVLDVTIQFNVSI